MEGSHSEETAVPSEGLEVSLVTTEDEDMDSGCSTIQTSLTTTTTSNLKRVPFHLGDDGPSTEVTEVVVEKSKPRLSFFGHHATSEDFSDIPKMNGRWVDNSQACDYFTSTLTWMYALLLTIFSLALEFSEKLDNQNWLTETCFYLYMYGAGIVFFLYCYIFMLYPGWFNLLQRVLHKYKFIKDDKKWAIIKTSHTGEGAGSLYLRLGALFFGTVGIVLYGLEVFLCANTYSCPTHQTFKLIIAGIFTFIQMHFIFCNSKISIVGSRNLAKIGTMHLVAVNIWTWFRFVLTKQQAKAKKIQHYRDSSSSEEDSGEVIEAVTKTLFRLVTFPPQNETTQNSVPGKLLSFDQFGDVATFLTTCSVEYSLIGAAVMFVIWRGIEVSRGSGFNRVKRKHKMRIDCSNSSTGIFAGILFLITAFVSIGVYSFFACSQNRTAQLVFGVVDLILFTLSLLACLVGLYRLRLLSYRYVHSNAEVLDQILLVIGLMGELVYCCVSVDHFISTQSTKHRMQPYFIVVFILRMVQVIVQAVFILLAGRLRATGPDLSVQQPGKQLVTFLLVANVTLFFFHTFEGMKSSFGLEKGASTAYSIAIYAVAPLIVFYRFHSSVCLAEIWKHAYSMKNHDTSSTTSNISSANSQVTFTA